MERYKLRPRLFMPSGLIMCWARCWCGVRVPICVCGAGTVRRRGCARAAALAALQGTHIGDDRPTVLNGNLGGIAGHCAPPICDHVKEVAYRRIDQPLISKRCRCAITAANDHAISRTRQSVADRAVDLIALLPALHHLFGNWKWK